MSQSGVAALFHSERIDKGIGASTTTIASITGHKTGKRNEIKARKVVNQNISGHKMKREHGEHEKKNQA